jgi:putative transposase
MRPRREPAERSGSTYFVSTQTIDRGPFFRHDRWARLMLDVLQHYHGPGYTLHAYVIMPDHLHLLLSPKQTIEKSVQRFKGGFFFRAKRELGWNGEVWQPGFTDHRIRDVQDWERHIDYIRLNPVKARLASDADSYEFIGFPAGAFPQGLKPSTPVSKDVRAKARTLQAQAVPAGDHTLRFRERSD